MAELVARKRQVDVVDARTDLEQGIEWKRLDREEAGRGLGTTNRPDRPAQDKRLTVYVMGGPGRWPCGHERVLSWRRVGALPFPQARAWRIILRSATTKSSPMMLTTTTIKAMVCSPSASPFPVGFFHARLRRILALHYLNARWPEPRARFA